MVDFDGLAQRSTKMKADVDRVVATIKAARDLDELEVVLAETRLGVAYINELISFLVEKASSYPKGTPENACCRILAVYMDELSDRISNEMSTKLNALKNQTVI